MLARAPLHQFNAATAMDLGTAIFLISARRVVSKNLGLVIKLIGAGFVRFVAKNTGRAWVGDSNSSRSGLLSI